MDRADKQSVNGGVNEGKDKPNKMNLKMGYLKHLKVSNEVPTRKTGNI